MNYLVYEISANHDLKKQFKLMSLIDCVTASASASATSGYFPEVNPSPSFEVFLIYYLSTQYNLGVFHIPIIRINSSLLFFLHQLNVREDGRI